MSEKAQRVENKNIPKWAQGLYYSSGITSEVLVYYDDEAIYPGDEVPEDMQHYVSKAAEFDYSNIAPGVEVN